MGNILGFPADVSLAMLGLVVAYDLLAHLPIWLAVVVAFWPRRLRRKLLFICVSSAITYGLLVMAISIIALPLEALATYVLPEWQALGYYDTLPPLGWLAVAAEMMEKWWYISWPALCALLGWFVVTRLARHWNSLIAAVTAAPGHAVESEHTRETMPETPLGV